MYTIIKILHTLYMLFIIAIFSGLAVIGWTLFPTCQNAIEIIMLAFCASVVSIVSIFFIAGGISMMVNVLREKPTT